MAYTLGELAAHVEGAIHGDADSQINSVASLEAATEGSISFIYDKHYVSQLETTSASAVILSRGLLDKCPVAAIVCDNPHLAFTKIATLLHPLETPPAGVHDSAVVAGSAEIHASASIGANVVIEAGTVIGAGVNVGAGCFVGRDCHIDESSRLVANVTICDGVVIGRNAILHPGVVIGSDGFGLSKEGDRWLKVPQLGSVIIGDDVEIGANTTVDRGALGNTIIGHGVKLDNQIQIAHNVCIGDNTAVAGCVGIAGSTRIGKRCTLAGGVGLVGHIEIADDTHITGMSLVTRSITTPGVYSSGTPLQENRDWQRNFVRFRQLDDMAKRLKSLEKKLAELEKD